MISVDSYLLQRGRGNCHIHHSASGPGINPGPVYTFMMAPSMQEGLAGDPLKGRECGVATAHGRLTPEFKAMVF